MIQSQAANLAYRLAEIGDGKEGSFAFTFPLRTRPRLAKLNFPNGLVVSSDEGVSQTLAGIMNQCGLGTFLAFTVGESWRILDHHQVCLVLCDDRLIDGKYEHILSATGRLRAKNAGDRGFTYGRLARLLESVCAGAFDYLALRRFLGIFRGRSAMPWHREQLRDSRKPQPSSLIPREEGSL